jgi:hypothetical protein
VTAAAGECSLDPAILFSSKLIYATSPALGHMQEGHPESNMRVPAILDALTEAHLTPQERPGDLVFLVGPDAVPCLLAYTRRVLD